MLNEIGHSIIKRYDMLASTRMPYERTYRTIDKYILNTPTMFQGRTLNGSIENDDIYDTTAITSNDMLAAAIHSGLTSTAKKWFDLAPLNPTLKNIDSVKRWIDAVVEIMINVFNSTESNFAQQNHEAIKSLTSYGTCCLYIEADKNGKIRFTTRHLSEIFITEDAMGSVDTVFRSFEYTARQAVQAWGMEACGEKITQSLESDPDKKFKFVHACMPVEDARLLYKDEEPISPLFNYIAYTACLDTKVLVERKGYESQPYIVGRFDKLPHEIYGRSPAWKCLPDVLMVNKMSETVIEAGELAVRPPFLVPDDGVITELNTYPNGITVGAVSPEGRQLVVPLQSGGNIGIGLEMMEQRREAIRRAYYVNQYFAKQGTPLTATEFAKRSEDELALGSPNLFRIRSEYLSKVVNRVFSLLLRNQQLPPVPRELLDKEGKFGYTIEYINPLIKQQRFDELDSVNRAIQAAMPVIQNNPQVLDVLDGDKWFRNALDIAGVPLSSIRKFDPKENKSVDDIRNERMQQQQAMMMMQQQQGGQ